MRWRIFSAKGERAVDPNEETIIGRANPATNAPIPNAGSIPGAAIFLNSGLTSSSSANIFMSGSIRSTAEGPISPRKLVRIVEAASLIPSTTNSPAVSSAPVRVSARSGIASRSAVANPVACSTIESAVSWTTSRAGVTIPRTASWDVFRASSIPEVAVTRPVRTSSSTESTTLRVSRAAS